MKEEVEEGKNKKKMTVPQRTRSRRAESHTKRPAYMQPERISQQRKRRQSSIDPGCVGRAGRLLQLETFGTFDQPIRKLGRDSPYRQIVLHLIERRNGACIRIGPQTDDSS
jgi:hypothetical protein